MYLCDVRLVSFMCVLIHFFLPVFVRLVAHQCLMLHSVHDYYRNYPEDDVLPIATEQHDYLALFLIPVAW